MAESAKGPQAGTTRRTPVTVLAVGNIAPRDNRKSHGTATDSDTQIVTAGFEELTSTNLARWRPDIVLSPLVDTGFDCVDLARRLCDLGYAGRYRVAAAALPNPELIRREVAAACPGLDFGLVVA